jgi:uncharacterized protein YhbP (UPF0306 family)
MIGLRFTAIHKEDAKGTALDLRTADEELARRSVFKILENTALCSMATVSADGRPHINTAYFSYSDALELYFLSHPESLHCRNLSSNPSTAVAVFSSIQRWIDPGEGVQLFGAGEQTSGSSAREAERSYTKRFDAYATWRSALKRGDVANEYRFYRFRPSELKIFDESTFGDGVFLRARIERS